MTSDSHSSLIKTPKQLIIVVVLAFLVPVTVISFIVHLVASGPRSTNDASPDERRVLERIRPVGQVVLADAAASQAPGATATASAQGTAGGVPAGSTNIAKASSGIAPPDAAAASSPAPGAPTPPAPASAPAGGQTAAPAAVAAAAKPDGKKVFDTTCSVCHGAGIAGAPKFGDKAAWAPRIAQGINVLHQHALQGFQGKQGVMPPKGGNTALSDAEVQAAVDYMAAAAK